MRKQLAGLFTLALFLSILPAVTASAQVTDTDITYTNDADFDQGTLVSVNHDAPFNDQLQLDSPTEPFPFINVAASGRGTVVRVNTDTGVTVGEYRTAPEGRGLNPSRTTVDLFGNVWTANREEVGEIDGVPHGSAVKIGLIVGGTRTDAAGTPDPSGGFLAPPFGYSTCIDRNADGLIRTSMGLEDTLDWPDVTDGLGGSDGLVEDAVDECILIYQRLPDAEQARHVSVDADNNVWVGGFPFELRHFYKLDGSTGAMLDSFDARDIGCGGYGGLIDGNGVLWSIGWGWGEGPLLRYDPATRTGSCVNTHGGYGLGIDTNGYVWASIWNNGIAKVSPDGVLEPGFPKSTSPTSSTTAATASPLTAASQSALSPMAAPMNGPAAEDDPVPTFWVSPDDDWVQSNDPWAVNATISLTIEDGSGVIYTDSQTADGSGYFNFGDLGGFDLQRGHIVTVSDGTTTKAHSVVDLYVDGVDVTADTVFGRADAGTEVHVWVHDDGDLTTTADGSGNWTADFSATTDLTYNSDGGSQQSDSDGDSTGVWWAGPRFQVSPDDNWVQSSGNWTPGATISLTIEDGSGVVHTDSQTADGSGYFNFGDLGGFNLQRGHTVTVTDGITTKTHTVTNLYVDGIDLVADTISGRADAGTEVHAWVNGFEGMTVTADGSGGWIADYSGIVDITEASNGGAQQSDIDGDSSHADWSYPAFQVAPDDDWVQSNGRWTPGATISLTIEDGSGVVHSDSQIADGAGNFNFGDLGGFDLQRGHIVTVTDGTTTKTHTVIDLYVDGVDVAAETVFGRTDPNGEVHVWVHGVDVGLTTAADGSGNWIADFSATTDLTYNSDGGSQQSDSDGDSTGVWWASPRFQVAPDDDWVQSDGWWTPGATISLTIEDGSGVIHTDSQIADDSGRFNFNLWNTFDLQRGHIVTVTDGTTTKTHTVIDLYVDGVDVAADTVFGRTYSNGEVHVWVHDTDSNLNVTADSSGNWTADFSAITDLTYNSDGGSQQSDADGDSTGVWWASPKFRVGPDDDWVESSGPWDAAATISLTIEDGSGVIYSGSQTADTGGYFYFGDLGGFDIQSGHIVTVTDGTTTKSHTVTGVNVTDIDTAADEVHGTSEPDAWVQVNAGLFDDWSSRWVQADPGGIWTADFSVPAEEEPAVDITDATFVDVDEFDHDGDATARSFGPPVVANRGLAVTPVDNHVWMANSNVGTVTRLDNDGNVLKVIETGDHPTGVAVDAAGKVWVTNLGADNTVRIDPSGGSDGLGAVDLTVDLGEGAGPYNYSDMTGAVVVGSTSPQGFWTVVQDSGEAGFEWGRITWNTEPEASEPAGTEIVVESRTSDSEAGLGGEAFVAVSNGELFSSFGRFVEVRVTLKASSGGLSPVLSDVRVQPAIIEVDIDIKPGSYPNSINVKRTTGVIPVAVLGSADFDVMTIDTGTLRFGPDLAMPAHGLTNPDTYVGHLEDVNADGFMDLVSHYVVGDTGLAYGDTQACLIGETVSGIPIEGCDSVRILGKKR